MEEKWQYFITFKVEKHYYSDRYEKMEGHLNLLSP